MIHRPTVGVFDAGIGGIPIAASLQRRGYGLVYLGDAARRPYGPQSAESIIRYVGEAERFFAGAACDLWVIACNTASVVAQTAVQGLLPHVDMVQAVTAEFGPDNSGPVGLLATAATVASGAFVTALPTYDVRQIATEELLRLAEEGGSDTQRIQALASDAFGELADAGCSTAILACTDFTCVLDDLREMAKGIDLFDPLDSAVRLVQSLAPISADHVDTQGRNRLVLTGPHPVDVVAYARERFGLQLPKAEYVDLAGPSDAAAGPHPRFQCQPDSP